MLQLRVIAPPERTDDVTGLLDECDGVATLTVFRDSSVRPPGDLLIADVARESVEGLMNGLREMGIDSVGSISLITVDATVSKAAEYAEKAAPGEGADAVIWEEAVRRTSEESVLSRTFVMFLTLATLLAGIAVLLDSAILVVGAMVVGPEFGPMSGAAVGLVQRRFGLLGTSLRTLVIGFAVAILVTTILAFAAASVNWIEADMLQRERPLTAYIWKPDRWSFVVAFIAGVAGVLSVLSAKSGALTGVFISVTTVPAAGNFAVALALGDPAEMAGSAAQLGINVGAILVAGVLTIVVYKLVQRSVRPRRSG